MTFEITLNDEDFKTVSEYPAKNKISISKFFLKSALEKIQRETVSNTDLLKISDKIISQRQKVHPFLYHLED